MLLFVCCLAPRAARAEMDWTELESDAAAASETQVQSLSGRLGELIQGGDYVGAVELAYGESGPLPKQYRKMAVDNAIAVLKAQFESGRPALAAQEMMDFAIRFPQVKFFKRTRNDMFSRLVRAWEQDAGAGENDPEQDLIDAGRLCVLARGLASWSLRNFREHSGRGVKGFELARHYCPEGMDIAYNLGLAYYRTGARDAARRVWTSLAELRPRDHALLANLGWLALEEGNLDLADAYAMKTLAARPSDANGLAVRLEVLFARGRYGEALNTVFGNQRQVTPIYERRAVDYAAAQCWSLFRSGKRDAALAEAGGLAKAFPQAEEFLLARQAMEDLLAGKQKDMPPPMALPHLAPPGTPIHPPGFGVVHEAHVIDPAPGFRRKESQAYALVVGVEKYANMAALRCAEGDAEQFAKLLTRRMGFPGGEDNLRVLVNEQAASRKFMDGVRWLARVAAGDPQAMAVLYFSGKGAPLYGKDRKTVTDLLLMPHDGDPDHLHNGKPVFLSSIKEAFGGLDNPNILVILDCGFFGEGKSIGLGRDLSPTAAPGLFDWKHILVTAADVEHEAEEFPGGKQGAFSYFFLEALLGQGDANQDGWVDAAEAFSHAARELQAQGIVQNPRISKRSAVKMSRVK